MRPLNIILFSSGVTEKNGLLDDTKAKLEKLGYVCSYWRDLFSNALHKDRIALLQILIKKIPTFDFAILIAEGHDHTVMLRGGKIEEVDSMRDNVLFEIGLCCMALGLSRVVLLTDSKVHLPDDLTGTKGKLALKQIIYDSDSKKSQQSASLQAVDYILKESAVEEMDDYIKRASGYLSPVVVGAAATTSIGYVGNFILRTLEHIHEGIVLENVDEVIKYPLEKIEMHIILPEKYSDDTHVRAAEAVKHLKKAWVPTARLRRAEFQYCTEKGKTVPEKLIIYDYPTTLVTSFNTARIILQLEAEEDSVDTLAEERFTAKELDLFKATLLKLLDESFIRETVSHYYRSECEKYRENMIRRLTEFVKNNVFIDTLSY